jgi:hypothetical protein
MVSRRHRLTALLVLSSGMLLAGGCDVADQILSTIGLAFRIVDVWV